MYSLTQGTIITGVRSDKYSNIRCNGVVISARCDLANCKISKIYCNMNLVYKSKEEQTAQLKSIIKFHALAMHSRWKRKKTKSLFFQFSWNTKICSEYHLFMISMILLFKHWRSGTHRYGVENAGIRALIIFLWMKCIFSILMNSMYFIILPKVLNKNRFPFVLPWTMVKRLVIEEIQIVIISKRHLVKLSAMIIKPYSDVHNKLQIFVQQYLLPVHSCSKMTIEILMILPQVDLLNRSYIWHHPVLNTD